MEGGMRIGEYLVKARRCDKTISGKIVSGGGNVVKTRVTPGVSSGKTEENKAKISEDKKEKKRPRLILSDSESDEDFGTDRNGNGSVDRTPIKFETIMRTEEGGVGRNTVKIGGFKHSKEGVIHRKEIKAEPESSFRKREEGDTDRKRFTADRFKYPERSIIGRKEIDTMTGPWKRKEDSEVVRSKLMVDHFNRREEFKGDQKKIKVETSKEAEINRKRISAVDSLKYREEAVKRIKIDQTRGREEADIDRKRFKIVSSRSKEESEAKTPGVKDVKLLTYARQREGKNGSSGNSLSDIRSQQPIAGKKSSDSTVVGRQKEPDHSDAREFRMKKVEHSDLDGLAREKLRLSRNHSIRLQGVGGVLKLTPNHKKPAGGFPEVSRNHRKTEGMVRNGRSEANLPMQKKVSHQPPCFDSKKSGSSPTVPKKNQGGGSSSFLTDRTLDHKTKDTDIFMRDISPKMEKISGGETNSQPESSAVIPLSSKKMETKPGDFEPLVSKKMGTKHVGRGRLSRKIVETKHAVVSPSSSKKMETEHVDVVPSLSKMTETKHVDVESLSSKNMETKHVDMGKKKETKTGEALRLREQRLLLRERLRETILNAGWKIELRPRRGRDYQDSVYISPDGVGYWSIVNAYNALLRESSCKEDKSEGEKTDIPIEDLSILTRKTKAKELREHGVKKGKKIKEHGGHPQSVKVKDGSQRKNLKGPTKQHLAKKKHVKGNLHTSKVKINSGIAREGKMLKGRIKENDGSNSKGLNRNLSNGNSDSSHPSDRVDYCNVESLGILKPYITANISSVQGKNNRNSRGLMVRGSSKADPNLDDQFIPYSGKRNVLSWLIDSGVVPENGKVHYMNKKLTRVMMEGWITRDGIHCGCCSKIVSVSKFEIHAGSKLHQPYQNILLETGISLMQCQLKAWDAQDESERCGFHVVDLDGSDKNDDTCGICGDGGDLICCDSCPSTFHLSCLDLETLPPGDWHCPHCSCKFCGIVVGISEGEDTTISPILSCVQCEQKYHCDCSGEMDAMAAGSIGPHPSFCGKECQKLFKRLQDLLGVKNDLDGGFSWTLIHRFDDDPEMSRRGLAQRAECNSKIAVALSVMDECFMPIIDQRSRINLIRNVVYNCGSNFNRLNYGGFYTVLLERGDDIISAASIRIHGTRLAEMPLIGTRHIYRRQGMWRRLLNAIETVLCSLKVEKLVIPAISDLMQTWTAVFGFKPLEEWHRQEMRSMNMMVFPGTDMLQKKLSKCDFTGSKSSESVADVINELKCGQHSASMIANQYLVASAPKPYIQDCSQGNLCVDSEVIESKVAPDVGCEHAYVEHIVDSNGSEALPSIPSEDSEIMCPDVVNELKCGQDSASEVANQSFLTSAHEPYIQDCSQGNICDDSEVTGSKAAPNVGSDHASVEHIIDSNGSEALPSIPSEDSEIMCTDVVNELKCDQHIVFEVAAHSLVASAHEPYIQDCTQGNLCDDFEASGSKAAANVGPHHAFVQHIVDSNGSEALPSILPEDSEIICTDVVNELKSGQHSASELANQSLVASVPEPCIQGCSQGNLCDDSEVTGSKAAPNVGSDHAYVEHIVDSNVLEALPSIPSEDSEIMCTDVVNELKCSPHGAFEMGNRSLVCSAPEPYIPDCSQGNLCDESRVIGSKDAPNAGSAYASGEDVVDSNGSEVPLSIQSGE